MAQQPAAQSGDRAPSRAAVMKGLNAHAIVFAVVMTILIAINARGTRDWWAQWPLLGWGAGLGVHALLASRYQPTRSGAGSRVFARFNGRGGPATGAAPGSPVAWWRRTERRNASRSDH